MQSRKSEESLALKLFNVQSTLKGIIQQLERLQGVCDKARSCPSLDRSKIGDRNHVTIETNCKALQLKTMCLHGILDQYQNEHSQWKDQCGNHIFEWFKQQGTDVHFDVVCAVHEVLSIVAGLSCPEVPHIEMTSEDLQERAARLYHGIEHHRNEEAKVTNDPRGYLLEDQPYKIDIHERPSSNFEFTVAVASLRKQIDEYHMQPQQEQSPLGDQFPATVNPSSIEITTEPKQKRDPFSQTRRKASTSHLS